MARIVFATAFGGPEVLSLADEAVADPGPGEVTIQLRAAAVNPLDYLLYSGMFGDDPRRLPIRVGLELAGVVTAAGPHAMGPAGPVLVGDEVIAYPGDAIGAYASEVTWPARGVVPKPSDFGWAQASGLLFAGATAVHALTATGVTSNDVVLIHGVSGGVGMIAAQLAIYRGAHVIGTASPARHAALEQYGITPVSYGDGLAERVRIAAGLRGVDATLDAVGTDEAIDTSLAVMSDRERIATIVAFERGNEAGIKTLGAGGGATDPGTDIRSQAWSELVSLAADGKLEVIVARTFALEEAAAATELVMAGHAGGKVVLLP